MCVSARNPCDVEDGGRSRPYERCITVTIGYAGQAGHSLPVCPFPTLRLSHDTRPQSRVFQFYIPQNRLDGKWRVVCM
jgi:hypothetical protein